VRKAHKSRDGSSESLVVGSAWGLFLHVCPNACLLSQLRRMWCYARVRFMFAHSGGVAVNKLLAKLGCGLHKPNQMTLVLPRAVARLLGPLPIDRLQVKQQYTFLYLGPSF